jgi:hypothetical protein
MVFPVHLQRSAVVAIVDCPDLGQFIGSLSLKQAALQWVCLFQEALIMHKRLKNGAAIHLAGKHASSHYAIPIMNAMK